MRRHSNWFYTDIVVYVVSHKKWRQFCDNFFVFQMCSVTHYSVTTCHNMSQSVTLNQTNTVLGRSFEMFWWEANRNICIVYFLLLFSHYCICKIWGKGSWQDPPGPPKGNDPKFRYDTSNPLFPFIGVSLAVLDLFIGG